MSPMNFLPMEIKEDIFKANASKIKLAIVSIIFVNIYLAINLVLYLRLNTSVKVSVPKVSDTKVIPFVAKADNDSLDFYLYNIKNQVDCMEADINGDLINLKIKIGNNNDFSECIKKLDNIKKININSLVAPYEENNVSLFEVVIRVLK